MSVRLLCTFNVSVIFLVNYYNDGRFGSAVLFGLCMYVGFVTLADYNQIKRQHFLGERHKTTTHCAQISHFLSSDVNVFIIN